MSHMLRIFITSLILISSVGCAHHPAASAERAPDARKPLIAGGAYSYAPYEGADAISVMLLGNVEHQGAYELKGDSSLYDFLVCAGNYAGHGDFGGVPSGYLLLKRPGSPDHKIEHQVIASDALKGIKLRDGDLIFIPAIFILK